MNYRYTAKIVMETESPMALSSGEKGLTIDKLIYKDKNGLPSIPGTSIVGVMRHLLAQNHAVSLFGREGTSGEGSRIIVTSAQMIGKNGSVIDCNEAQDMTEGFYSMFRHLPVRQHVRMTDKGAAYAQGKFDEEILFKGTRFVFEIELKGDGKDSDDWKKILALFTNDGFRLGGGTRKGFGSIKTINIGEKIYDLAKADDRKAYLLKSSSLSGNFYYGESQPVSRNTESMKRYQILIEPDDFFIFSSGFGSDDADITPVTEKTIVWDDNSVPEFTDKQTLIPASSVKGAIAHRTAYHFNKMKGITAELIESSDTNLIKEKLESNDYLKKNADTDRLDKKNIRRIVTELNPAVRDLFGFSVDEKSLAELIGLRDNCRQRGKVIISDIFKKQNNNAKLLNHVKIDRFTGGAIDGALFSEMVSANDSSDENADIYCLDILVEDSCNDDHLRAFECSLEDLCSGMLPLGGGAMRGHGCFKGSIKKS